MAEDKVERRLPGCPEVRPSIMVPFVSSLFSDLYAPHQRLDCGSWEGNGSWLPQKPVVLQTPSLDVHWKLRFGDIHGQYFDFLNMLGPPAWMKIGWLQPVRL